MIEKLPVWLDYNNSAKMRLFFPFKFLCGFKAFGLLFFSILFREPFFKFRVIRLIKHVIRSRKKFYCSCFSTIKIKKCVLRSLGVNLMATYKTETKLHFHQKYFDHLGFTINSIRGKSSVKQYSKIATTK